MRGWGGELLLRVVGLLLRGLLGVARVGLSGRRGRWVASLSWSPLVAHVGHVGHVVLAVAIRSVAHRHLEVSAWTPEQNRKNKCESDINHKC